MKPSTAVRMRDRLHWWPNTSVRRPGNVVAIPFRFGWGDLRILNARCADSGVQKPVVPGVGRRPVLLIARCAGVVRTLVVLIARCAGVV
jgi:hypothetical protein